jgi:predicted transcriptional regulator
MMTDNTKSKILPGCSVLPPMEAPDTSSHPEATPNAAGQRKAKFKRNSHGQRWAMLNGFVDFTAASLSQTDALVWLVLFRDAKGKMATTAQTYIASRLKISRRTVVRSLDRLKKLGLITVVRRGGFNRGMNKYVVESMIPDEYDNVTLVSH